MTIEFVNDVFLTPKRLAEEYDGDWIKVITPKNCTHIATFSKREGGVRYDNQLIINFHDRETRIVKQLQFTTDNPNSGLAELVFENNGKGQVLETDKVIWEYFDVDYTNPVTEINEGSMTRAIKKHWRKEGSKYKKYDLQIITGIMSGKIEEIEVAEARSYKPVRYSEIKKGERRGELVVVRSHDRIPGANNPNHLEVYRQINVGDKYLTYALECEMVVDDASGKRVALAPTDKLDLVYKGKLEVVLIVNKSGLTYPKDIPRTIGKATLVRF